MTPGQDACVGNAGQSSPTHPNFTQSTSRLVFSTGLHHACDRLDALNNDGPSRASATW